MTGRRDFRAKNPDLFSAQVTCLKINGFLKVFHQKSSSTFYPKVLKVRLKSNRSS